MDTVSKPGLFYGIDCESVNAGVPYADTFYVTVHFCLSRISATETRYYITYYCSSLVHVSHLGKMFVADLWQLQTSSIENQFGGLQNVSFAIF